MATVVDELILKFSLDPTNFDKGQKKTVDSLRKLEEDARTAGKGVEDSGQKMVDAFGRVTREVLTLGAAFLGVSGLKELVVGTVTAGANLDVMSKALNANIEMMNRWQNVGRQFGVAAETTGAALANIITLQQQLREGKVGPDALGLNSLFALAGVTNQDLLGDTGALLEKIHKGTIAHPADAAGLLSTTPFAALQPSLQTPDLNKRLEEGLTLTREQAKAAQDVRDEFVKLTELLEGRFNKALLDNIRPIKELIEAIRKVASGDFSGAQAIDEKLGAQAHEGLSGIGNWLWGFMTPHNLAAPGTPASMGATGGGGGGFGGAGGGATMPMPRSSRGAPPVGGAWDFDSDYAAAAGHPGRWTAPYLAVQSMRGEAGGAAGFGNFGSVTHDNSRAISIAHVSITPPPGTDERAWASSFISAVTAQASSGSR